MSERFYGTVTQRYYESEKARDHYERTARLMNAARDPDPTDPWNPDAVSPEAIAAAIATLQNSEVDQVANDMEKESATIFCEVHPEFVQNERNAAVMVNWARESGLVCDSVEKVEGLYEDLRSRGLLDIDESQAQAQNKNQIREAAQRYRKSSGISAHGTVTARRPVFSEDEAYTMDMDKLIELARNAERNL